MRRSMLVAALGGTLATGVLAGTTIGDNPPEADAGAAFRCSRASLNGSYGISFDGQSTSFGRFASVSLWKFDGRGKLTATEKFNSENSGPQSRNIGGRYTVKSDCTFRLLFPSELAKEHEAVGECVLVAAAREFSCLDSEEGWVTLGHGTKVTR